MIYDEGAFIPKEMYTATLPFTAVSSDFRTSGDLNPELFPKQIPNLNLFLSSASDITSEMYAQYREAFRQMMMGNTAYFVCDLDYHQSTAPFLNGKPMKPLVSMEEVERMYATQPYKAEREFGNKWSADQGEDILVKRSTIEKDSVPMYPEFSGDGKHQYIISYDPASRLDNSIICVGELIRDEKKGLMIKFVYMKNLIEVLKSGQKVIKQKPEQVEILKDIILKYNNGYQDYDGIDMILIDAGAGGGGFDIGSQLLNEWKGRDGKYHRGFIDPEDDYMKLRLDDFPQNSQNFRLFNFKRDKTNAYEATANAINQGLVVFPKGLNIRNELEFEEEDPNGGLRIRYEKPSLEEMDSIIQFDLAKEELLGMQKEKKPNGTVVFSQSPAAKQNDLHDDRADAICMQCFRLMQLRVAEETFIEQEKSDFTQIFESNNNKNKTSTQGHFDSRRERNPFTTGGRFRF